MYFKNELNPSDIKCQCPWRLPRHKISSYDIATRVLVQVRYLIVSIPNLCTLTYFYIYSDVSAQLHTLVMILILMPHAYLLYDHIGE